MDDFTRRKTIIECTGIKRGTFTLRVLLSIVGVPGGMEAHAMAIIPLSFNLNLPLSLINNCLKDYWQRGEASALVRTSGAPTESEIAIYTHYENPNLPLRLLYM